MTYFSTSLAYTWSTDHCVICSGITYKIILDTDQFQLSLSASKATSNIQDFHVEANFLLRQTNACKYVTKTQVSISGAVTGVQNIKHRITEMNRLTSTIAGFNITYSHIKDTAGIRYGMNIHLVNLTGAGNVRPEGRARKNKC